MSNPMNFPVYTRRIRVVFSSPETAEKARAAIAPLPFGKKIAVTSRWDDSNPRHEKQAATLARNGWRGTFFLNAMPSGFSGVMRDAVRLGMSAGNHGTDHPYLTVWTLNALFRQIVLHQAQIESETDSPSVSFTVPCNIGGPLALCPGRPAEIGDLLARAGIFSHPEYFDPADMFGRSPDCCFGTHLFAANDRCPDEAAFRSGFEAAANAARNDHDCPRVTFGVHTWQSDEGFELLDRLYAEFGHRPDCWYCNENEYAAYRYQYRHATIEKTAVHGCEVEFTVAGFEPAELGASVPLRIEFEDNAAPSVDVPDAEGHALPEKIGRTVPGAACEKFPGLSCEVNRDGGTISVRLSDSTGAALENVRFVLIPPMAYRGNLYASGSTEAEFQPGPRSDDPQFDDDAECFLLRADFIRGGRPGRLYVAWDAPARPVRLSPVPRDTVLAAGPFPAGTVTEAFIAANGRPGTPLQPLGDAPGLVWRQPRVSGMMPYAFCPVGGPTEEPYIPFVRKPVTPEAHQAYLDAVRPVWDGPGEFLFAVEFDNGPGGDVFIPAGKEMKAFWLDGVPVPRSADGGASVHAGPGRHRLLILAATGGAWAYRCNGYWFGVYRTVPGKPLACFEPPF